MTTNNNKQQVSQHTSVQSEQHLVALQILPVQDASSMLSRLEQCENYIKKQQQLQQQSSQDNTTNDNTEQQSSYQQLLDRIAQLEQRLYESENHNKYISIQNDKLTIEINKMNNLYKTTQTIMNMLNSLVKNVQDIQNVVKTLNDRVDMLSNNIDKTSDNKKEFLVETEIIDNDKTNTNDIPDYISTPLYTVDNCKKSHNVPQQQQQQHNTQPIHDKIKYYYPHPSSINKVQRDYNIQLTNLPHYSQQYDNVYNRLQDIGYTQFNTTNNKTNTKYSSNGRNIDGSSMNINNTLGSRTSIKLYPEYSSGDTMKHLLTDVGMGIG